MSTSNDILSSEFSALLKKYNDKIRQDTIIFQEKSNAIIAEYQRRKQEIDLAKYKPIN